MSTLAGVDLPEGTEIRPPDSLGTVVIYYPSGGWLPATISLHPARPARRGRRSAPARPAGVRIAEHGRRWTAEELAGLANILAAAALWLAGQAHAAGGLFDAG